MAGPTSLAKPDPIVEDVDKADETQSSYIWAKQPNKFYNDPSQTLN